MSSTVAAPPLLATMRELTALTKPRVTLLVIVTAGGGLFLAPGRLGIGAALGILAAIAVVVGAANALNCWLERESDKHMSRTRGRPLPAGRLDPSLAMVFGLALAVLSLPALAVLANPLTAVLGAVALVSYVGLYTPLKRVTPKALLVGAVPGAMPPLMGWTAVTGTLDAAGLILFAVLFLWQLPHFLAIAVFREREYAKAGIKVLPAVRGARAANRHAIGYAVLLVPVSAALFAVGAAGGIYLAAALLLSSLYAAVAIAGLFVGATPRWARKLFLVSLAYLPLLYLALVADAALR